MKKSPLFASLLGGVMLVSTLLAPLSAGAATSAYAQDLFITVAGVQLRVMSGSVASAFSAGSDALTVTVPDGEAFELRTVDNRSVLENDGLLSTCDVMKDLSNRLFIVGPRTVVVRPSALHCSTADAANDSTPIFSFSSPATGTSVASGQTVQFFWTTEGKAPAGIRLRLSVDGGKTYQRTLADNAVNFGYFSWNVPDMPSASAAVLKIEAIDGGTVTAMGVSSTFAIQGTSPEVVAPAGSGGVATVSSYDYEVDEEIRTAATIGVDKGLVSNPSAQICMPDTRLKAKGSDAVYYCGKDGKRYVFPNFKTYHTWYGDDFNGVVELDLADVQRIPLGGNVTYRPGARMVKVQTAPDVFAVAADGTLRYVSEKAAVRLYGADWNKMIDDLPDAFFTNYRIGEPVKE